MAKGEIAHNDHFLLLPQFVQLCLIVILFVSPCVAWWALRITFFLSGVCLSVTLFRYTFNEQVQVTHVPRGALHSSFKRDFPYFCGFVFNVVCCIFVVCGKGLKKKHVWSISHDIPPKSTKMCVEMHLRKRVCCGLNLGSCDLNLLPGPYCHH